MALRPAHGPSRGHFVYVGTPVIACLSQVANKAILSETRKKKHLPVYVIPTLSLVSLLDKRSEIADERHIIANNG
jgi:hypothetical protein